VRPKLLRSWDGKRSRLPRPRSVRVTVYGVDTRPQWLVRLGGIAPQQPVFAFSSSIANMERSVVDRIFYEKNPDWQLA